MKKVIHKIGSFLMALLVLFSTMSFTVNQHFCGKTLMDSSVFSEVESCCPHDSDKKNEKDLCCDEQKLAVEGQNELQLTFEQIDFQQQIFLSAFTFSFIDLFEGLPEQVIPFKDYSPPLLVADIQVLDQVFLI